MSEEIRVVTRQETFNDLAVRELAKGRSACLCRIQFGRCDKTECAHCTIGKQYRNCYNAMNDYDRNRLASYVATQYAIDSKYPEQWMSHADYVRYFNKWYGIVIAFVLFCTLIISMFIVGPGDKPNKGQGRSLSGIEKMIVVTMLRTQLDIKDLNLDDKVNCIDYACMFKRVWDYYFPDNKDRCTIVRNQGPGIHHLFICIWWEGLRIDVEPWASDPYKYLMTDNWNKVYNSNNNIYGETERWLKEIRDEWRAE